jgi:hypothetical protein
MHNLFGHMRGEKQMLFEMSAKFIRSKMVGQLEI